MPTVLHLDAIGAIQDAQLAREGRRAGGCTGAGEEQRCQGLRAPARAGELRRRIRGVVVQGQALCISEDHGGFPVQCGLNCLNGGSTGRGGRSSGSGSARS
jgi:hypothetical protein